MQNLQGFSFWNNNSTQFEVYKFKVHILKDKKAFKRNYPVVCLSHKKHTRSNKLVCNTCGTTEILSQVNDHCVSTESLSEVNDCSSSAEISFQGNECSGSIGISSQVNGCGSSTEISSEISNPGPSVEQATIVDFHKAVQGPVHVCQCCKQTWFKESVSKAVNIPDGILQQCQVGKADIICCTCKSYLKTNRIPPCSVANGMTFPSKPKELELTELEERLVAPRIPFMQLREKPRGGQLCINGNAVNVQADVTSTVKKMPRMLSENETIALNFKRSLNFKHSVASERIRPNKVFVAAKWLVENSALYKSEGIEVNQSWVHSLNTEESNSTETSSLGNNDLSTSVNSSTGESSLRKSENEIDSWTEDSNLNDRPSGNTDTVLQSVNFR